MKQTLNLSLGTFTLAALVEGEPAETPRLIASRVGGALRYYLAEDERERPGWRYPTFLDRGEAGEQVPISVDVDAAVWGDLEREAEDQRITPERLAEHAILYFISDRDSGRVTQRVLDDAED
jgi:hypothetical protein